MKSSMRKFVTSIAVTLMAIGLVNCTEPKSITCKTGIICPSGTTCAVHEKKCLSPNEDTGSICGDGIVDSEKKEECDDGNTINNDGCSSACKVETCGDGIVQTQFLVHTYDDEGLLIIKSTPDNSSSRIEICDPGMDGVGPENCLAEDTPGGDGQIVHACQSNLKCGNGIVDPGEVCDHGNSNGVGSNNCSRDCGSDNSCGNGIIDNDKEFSFEECDIGNEAQGLLPVFPENTHKDAKCITGCVIQLCGDGKVNGGEVCDPGAVGASNFGCNSDCTASKCGDGKVNLAANEQCDTGNPNDATQWNEDGSWKGSGDCTNTCTVNRCGDYYVGGNEKCDDGTSGSALCARDCKKNVCGDGYFFTNTDGSLAPNSDGQTEECDDGATGSRSCTVECTRSSCGDGIVNTLAGEECDPGTTEVRDSSSGNWASCNSDCTLPRCGDNLVNTLAGEECDPSTGTTNGNPKLADLASARCNIDCSISRCGDNKLNEIAGEACDHGLGHYENVTLDDGTTKEEWVASSVGDANCNYECSASVCGDGIINEAAGEKCDPGENVPKDSSGNWMNCNSDCTEPKCGDGKVNAAFGEECDPGDKEDKDDDGNWASCNSNCKLPKCGDNHFNPLAGEECDNVGGNNNVKEINDATAMLVTGALADYCSKCSGDGCILFTDAVVSQYKYQFCQNGAVIDHDNVQPVQSGCYVSGVLNPSISQENCAASNGAWFNSNDTLESAQMRLRAAKEYYYNTIYLKGGLYAEACYQGNSEDSKDCLKIHCGNGRIDFGEVCEKIVDASDENGEATEYHYEDFDGKRVAYCSSDCRSTGGCGNGVIDNNSGCYINGILDQNKDFDACSTVAGGKWQEEACDPPTNGCQQCISGLTCGNGKIEEGEQCDTGDTYLPGNHGYCIISSSDILDESWSQLIYDYTLPNAKYKNESDCTASSVGGEWINNQCYVPTNCIGENIQKKCLQYKDGHTSCGSSETLSSCYAQVTGATSKCELAGAVAQDDGTWLYYNCTLNKSEACWKDDSIVKAYSCVDAEGLPVTTANCHAGENVDYAEGASVSLCLNDSNEIIALTHACMNGETRIETIYAGCRWGESIVENLESGCFAAGYSERLADEACDQESENYIEGSVLLSESVTLTEDNCTAYSGVVQHNSATEENCLPPYQWTSVCPGHEENITISESTCNQYYGEGAWIVSPVTSESACAGLGTWKPVSIDANNCGNYGGEWKQRLDISAEVCTENGGTGDYVTISNEKKCAEYNGKWVAEDESCIASGGAVVPVCIAKSCTLAKCGDGYVWSNKADVLPENGASNPSPTEECDHGVLNASTSNFSGIAVDADGNVIDGAVSGEPFVGADRYCNYNCHINTCGDGITNKAAGEDCDWGSNTASNAYNGMKTCPNGASTCDICGTDCKWVPSGCGNGTIEEDFGEICDTKVAESGDYTYDEIDGIRYVKVQTECEVNGGYPCNVCLNCSEAKKYYSVTAVPDNEHGTIVASSIGIYCNSTSSGALCSVLTDRNAVEYPVEFQAIPEEGYRLANWNYPSDVCEVTTTDDENRQYVLTCKTELIDSTDSLKKLTIGAVFVAENYNVVVSNAAAAGNVGESPNVLGTVSGVCAVPEGTTDRTCSCASSGEHFACSGYSVDTVTLTATPNTADGYVFIRWEGGCPNVKLNYVGDTNTVASAECTGVVGTGWDIQPVFKKQYKLHYGIASVNAEGGSISSSVASDTLLDADSEVALVAVSNPGYTFTGWGTTADAAAANFTCNGVGGTNASNPCVIKMTADTDVFAIFEAINPNIELYSRIENAGDVEDTRILCSSSGDEGEGAGSVDCVEFQCRKAGEEWGNCDNYGNHAYYTETIEIKRNENGVAADSTYYQFTSWTGCTVGCSDESLGNQCCKLNLVNSSASFTVYANYASNKMRVDFSTEYDVTGENAVFNCADNADSTRTGLCSTLVFERDSVVTASLSLEGSTCQSDKFISLRDRATPDNFLQVYCECDKGEGAGENDVGHLTNCMACGENESSGGDGEVDASSSSGGEGNENSGEVTPGDEGDAGEGDEDDEDAEVIPGGGESGSGMVCTAKDQYHKTLEGGVPSLQLTLDQNRTVDVTYTRASTAKVSIAPYSGSNLNGTVTLTTSASANVAGVIQGIVAYCYGESKGNCSVDVGLNLQLKAEAEAADGYEFVGWRIDGSILGESEVNGEFINTKTPVITLTENTTVIPIFAPSLSVSMNRSIAAAQIRCGFDVVADSDGKLLITCSSLDGTSACEGILDTTTTEGESHCIPDGATAESGYVTCDATTIKYRLNSSTWTEDGSDGYYMYRACTGGAIIPAHSRSSSDLSLHINSSVQGTLDTSSYRCVIASNTGADCNGAYAYGTKIGLETLYIATYDVPTWKVDGTFYKDEDLYNYTEGPEDDALIYYGYTLSFTGQKEAMANYTISTKQQVAYENTTDIYGCYITNGNNTALHEEIETKDACDNMGGSWNIVASKSDDIECWQYGWVANAYAYEDEVVEDIPSPTVTCLGVNDCDREINAVSNDLRVERDSNEYATVKQAKTRAIRNPKYDFFAQKVGSSAEECALFEKNESLSGTTFFLLKVKAAPDRETNWLSRTASPFTDLSYTNIFNQNTYCTMQKATRDVPMLRVASQQRGCTSGTYNDGHRYKYKPCYNINRCVWYYTNHTSGNGYTCNDTPAYSYGGTSSNTDRYGSWSDNWPANLKKSWNVDASKPENNWSPWDCTGETRTLDTPQYKGYATNCLTSAKDFSTANALAEGGIFEQFVTSADGDASGWSRENTTCDGYLYVRLDSLTEGTSSFAYSPKKIGMQVPGVGVKWKSIKVADGATSADVPTTEAKMITAIPGQTVIAIAEAETNYSMADWAITGATCQHESTEAYSKAICQFVMPVGDVTLKPVAQETSHTLKLAVSGGTATCAIAEADAADCSAEGLSYSSANCQSGSNIIHSTTKLCVKVVPMDDTYELLGEPRCFLGTDLVTAANQTECGELTGCYTADAKDAAIESADDCTGANQTWKTATWQSTINGTSDVTYSCVSADATNYPTVVTSFVDDAQVGKTCLVNMATDNTVSANFTRKPQLSASIIPPKEEGSDEGGRNMSCSYKMGLDSEVIQCLTEWMTHDTYYFSGTNMKLEALVGADGYEFLESNNKQSCNGGTWQEGAVCSFIMSGPKTYSAYALFSLKPLLNVVFTPADGGELKYADQACSNSVTFAEGTWSVGPTSVATGSSHCLKATPNSFYEFLTTNNAATCNGGEWTAVGSSEPTSYMCSVQMLENAGDAYVNAIFTRRPVITVSSNADASTGTIACCDNTCAKADGSYLCCEGAGCCAANGAEAVTDSIPVGAQFPVHNGDSFCIKANILADHTLFDLDNSKCPGAAENKWTEVTENKTTFYRCNIGSINNTGAYTDTSVTAGFMKDGSAATTVIAYGDGLVQCKTIKTTAANTCTAALEGLTVCGHSTDITHYLGADESLCVVATGSDSTHTELNKAMSFNGCTAEGGAWSDAGVCVVAAGKPTVVVNFTAKPKLTTSVIGSGKLVSCENSSTEVETGTTYHSYASVAAGASSVDVCALPESGNTMDTASGCPGSSWSYVGNSYKCTVTMDSDKVVQASFTTTPTYKVNVTKNGDGTLKCVQLTSGEDCTHADFTSASACAANYTLAKHLDPATEAETLDYLCVQASTDADNLFKEDASFCPTGAWTDNGTGNKLCSVKYGESTATVVATFAAQPTLTVANLVCPEGHNNCGGIAVTANSNTLTAAGTAYTVAVGDSVTVSVSLSDANVELLAANNSGCPSSDGWIINNDHNLATCSWTMGEADVNLAPQVNVKPKLTVSVGAGADDHRVNCTSPFATVTDTETYHLTGAEVTVCVQPGPTHTLNIGSGCEGRAWTYDSTNEIYSCSVTMNGNQTVTATYTDIPSYAVTINGNGMTCAKSTVNVGSENSVDCTASTLTYASCGASQTLTKQDNKGSADTVDVLCVKGVSTDDLFFDAAASSCDGTAFIDGTAVNGVVDSGYCKVKYGKNTTVSGITRSQPTVTCNAVCNPTLAGCYSGVVIDTSGISCGSQVKAGTSIQASVTAPEHYEFLSAFNSTTCNGGEWTLASGTYTCSFIANVGAENSVRPVFTQMPKLTLVQRPGNSVTFYDCTNEEAAQLTDSELYYAKGTPVSICAAAKVGYTFDDLSSCPGTGWTDSNAMKKCTVTMDGDKSIVIVSSGDVSGALYVSADGNGTGGLQCAVGTYNYYKKNGVQWRENNVVTSNLTCPPEGVAYSACDPSYVLSSTGGEDHSGANAKLKQYLCVKASPGEGSFLASSTCESLNPSGQWREATQTCAINYSTTGNMNVVFTKYPTVTASRMCIPDAGETGCGTITPASTQISADNTQVNLTVEPDNDYEFIPANNAGVCPATTPAENNGWANIDGTSKWQCTWSMGLNDASITVEPIFTKMPLLTVNVGEGVSIVECGLPDGLSETSASSYHATGSAVDVCFQANSNYTLNTPEGCSNVYDLTGKKRCLVSMTGDKVVMATATSLTRYVSVNASGTGTVTQQVITSGTCADAAAASYASVTGDIGLNSGDTLCVKATATGDTEFKSASSFCPGNDLVGGVCSVAYADVEAASDRHVIMTFGAKPAVTVNVTGDGQIVACEASGSAFVSGTHVATGATADICVKASDGYQFNSSVGCPGEGGWTANSDNYKCHLTVSSDTNVYAGFDAVAASQMTVLVNSIGGASKCQVTDAAACPASGDASYTTTCTGSYEVTQGQRLCVIDGNDASAHVELNTSSSFCAGQTITDGVCSVPYTDNNPKTVVMVYAAEPTLTVNAPANSWTLYEGDTCTGTAITNLQHPTGTQLCVKAGTVAGATFDPRDGCNSGAWTQVNAEDYTCNVTLAANSAVTLNFIGTGTLAVATNLTGEPLPDYYEVFNGACGTENPASAVVGNFNEGTTLCVKQKAVTGYTFNDASGCPGTGWTLSDSVYQCEVTIAKGVTSTVTMNYAASAAFSIAVSGGTGYTDYSVATGTCALASSFATLSGTESYPVGQQLCIKALAEDDAHHLVLDTTRGCMWSDASEGYYVCDVTVRAPSTAMTIYVNPWGTLTVGTGVTVTQNACGQTAGASVADNAQVKSDTVLCATASKTNLLTAEGCPGGTWDTTGSDATCQFTMGSGNASVLANYALPEGQKTLTITPSGTGAVVYTGACAAVTAVSSTTTETAFDANTALCVVVDGEDTTNHRSLDVSGACHGTANWTDMANLAGKYGCDITIGSENVTLALSYIAYGQVSLAGTTANAVLYDAACNDVVASTTELSSGDYLKANTNVCAKVVAPGEYFDSATGCNGGAWTASESDYICDVTVASGTNTAVTLSYFDSTTLNVTWAVDSATFAGVTVAASTCNQAILADSTFSAPASSYRSGTSICVKVPANDAENRSRFDADSSTGCLWIARENEYICDVSMSGESVTLTLNAIAWPVLTNAGELTVKTGDCASGTAVEFDAEDHTASIKAGTTLCASAPADSVSSSIETTTGCPGSAWVVDGATATCTFVMPSSAAAIAASYTAWPVLTKGSGDVTVKTGDCNGTAVAFGEGTTASIKTGMTMCAQVSATTGDPARPLGTMTGCPGGSWQIIENSAVCIFTMPTTNAEVKAVYAPVAKCNLQWPLYIVPSVTNSEVDAAFTGTDPVTIYGRTAAEVSHLKLIYGTGTPDMATWQNVVAAENSAPTGLGDGFTKEYQATLSAAVLNALAGVETSYLFAVSGDGENWFYCPGTKAGGAPTQDASSITDKGSILLPAASEP